MGNIPRRRPTAVEPKHVELIIYNTVYGEDQTDSLYMPPCLRRTVGPVSALSKRQQAEYWAKKSA